MKQFLVTAAAVLVGMLAALLLYDQFVLKPRSAALAENLSDSAKVDLSNAQREAKSIAQNLDAEVNRAVAGAQQAMDDQAAEQEHRRLAVDAVNRAAMMKVAASEYYMSMGKWPANAKEAGLGPPSSFAGGGVSGIELGKKGAITIALSDSLAPGGHIRLTPDVDPQSYGINWVCTVDGSEALRRYLPACK